MAYVLRNREGATMYIPLQFRLTFFYMLILGVALWFFCLTVYDQAKQGAYSDLINNDLGSLHIIQTARSEQDIEQSLSDLQTLLLRGGALVLTFALVGGWFITWGVLFAVRGMTKTAQSISTSRNFSQRVPGKSR